MAELTGIHPVSIRKYETNKMQPQPPQLEKIAAALGVSYNALNGSDTAGLRLKTVGDLIGVLMVLCNSGVLQISGERGEDMLLKEETVSIQSYPFLLSGIWIFPSVICTRCTGFFCLAIIKGPPNDIYCIIEEPYKHYFTEKVSYSLFEVKTCYKEHICQIK